MKRLLMIALAVTVTVLWGAAMALAEPAEGQTRDKQGDRAERKHKRPGPHPLRGLFKDVNLTDEQKTQVKEALQGLKPSDEDRQKMQELRKQFRQAVKDKDLEKAQQVREQMKELRGEPGAKLIDALDDILTEEQLAQVKENMKSMREHRGRRGMRGRPHPARGLFKGVELTDEQKEQVKKAFEDLKPAEEDRGKARELFQALRQAHKDGDEAKVEQIKAQLKELHGDRHTKLLAALDDILTDEQMEKVKANIEEMKENRPHPRKRGQRDGDRRPRRNRPDKGGDEAGNDVP
jgi:Spy/CpxP family protein refolding chaperone